MAEGVDGFPEITGERARPEYPERDVCVAESQGGKDIGPRGVEIPLREH